MTIVNKDAINRTNTLSLCRLPVVHATIYHL
jgi:hypothetical protein